MEIQQILQSLKYLTESFPHEAVQAAIDRKHEMIPKLLDILDYTEKNVNTLQTDPDYFAHCYAVFLLAQFREKQAYSVIVRLLSHPDSILEPLFSDMITEDFPSILASVCHGDINLITQLIENNKIDEFVRGTALRALVCLVANDITPREKVIAYFNDLFRSKLERNASHVWNVLVSCSCKLQPNELYDQIILAYNDYLVDPYYIGMQDINKYLKRNWNECKDLLNKDRHYKLVDNTIERMNWWACFKPENQKKTNPKNKQRLNEKPFPTKTLPPRIRNKKGKKIGRNDPCPCGSRKKYKKCCGAPVRQ